MPVRGGKDNKNLIISYKHSFGFFAVASDRKIIVIKAIISQSLFLYILTNVKRMIVNQLNNVNKKLGIPLCSGFYILKCLTLK